MSNPINAIRVKPGNTRFSYVLLVLFLTTLMVGCSGMNSKSILPVSVSEIVQMSKAGEPDTAIIDRIRETGTVYRLSASQLADLRQKGVSNAVINYMQQTYLTAVRRNQQLNDQSYWTDYGDGYFYGGYPFGWEDGWYPDEPY